MKKISTSFFGSMVMVAILSFVWSSCSSELDHPALQDKSANVLAKAPKIEAYSGTTYWGPSISGGTRASNIEANQWYTTWDCFPPITELTQEDIDEIIRRLSKGEETHNTIILPFEHFWIQQVHKGTDEYIPTDINGTPVSGQKLLGSNFMDHIEATDKDGNLEHISNFNAGKNDNNPGSCQGCGKSLAGTVLVTNMGTENLNPETQYCYAESNTSPHTYYNNYFIIEYKGYYYLGFDYEMHKEAYNKNEVKDVARDWNFTDWIVRIIPAYSAGETPLDNPGGIQPGDWFNDKNPGGGDNNGDGNNGGSNPGGDNGGGTTTPATPTIGGDNHRNEIEANLGIDDKEGKYTESHLSLHVRSANNVDIFIPVPLKYVCPADDMEIVQKHFEGLMDHGGEIVEGTGIYDQDGKLTMSSGLLSKMTYKVGDEDKNWDVTLYVEYVEAGFTSSHGETFQKAGIHIWSEGINAEMMEYLFEKFGDGITFEIWNYYNEGTTLEELKQYLDETTIKFLGNTLPDYFINAFGESNNQEGKDCKVNMDESQADNYEYVGTGGHLNGSSHNEIYENKSLKQEADN